VNIFDNRDIANSNGRSVDSFDDGGGDVVGGLHQSDGTNIERLLAALDKSATGIGVVVGQRQRDLPERQAVGDELAGIDLNLIFASRSAENVDVDKVGNALELVEDEPVGESLEFHHVVTRARALEREEHDLAGGAVIGAEIGIHVGGKSDLLQPVEDLLAGVEGGDVIVVDDGDDREAGERDRTQVRFVGNTVERDFEGNGDLLFDFFGGVSRPLGDDLG